MPQLSASTLKLFQECPRCFWLRINRKLERPRGPFPSLPSGINRVLKSYFERYRAQGLLHQWFPFGVAVHTIATDPEAAYRIFTEGVRCLAGPLPRSGAACEFCRWAESRPADETARTIPDDLFA